MVVLFVIGHPVWALGALVAAIVSLLWPSSEQLTARVSPQEGLELEARRAVESPYRVEEPKPEQPES